MHPRDREIIRMYRGGSALLQVAEKYGLSKERVRQILVRERVKVRRRGAPIKLAPVSGSTGEPA